MLSEEQIKERIHSLGGSEASIVLGLNKYTSKVELFLQKTGQKEIEQNDSMPILWGNLSEDNVAKIFEMQTGKKVRKSNKKWVHPEYDFITGNLDRVVVGERAFLECKTATGWLAKEWEGEEVPLAYRVQCLHYLAVTGFERAYIAVMIDNSQFVWKVIERDEELIEMIIQEEVNFWNNHVLTKIPPSFDGSQASTNLLNELYPEAEKEELYLPSSTEQLINNFHEAKEFEKVWLEKRKEAENLIKSQLGEFEIGLIKDYVISWKNVDQSRVDTKLLKEKYPEVHADVMKTSSYRKFGIK